MLPRAYVKITTKYREETPRNKSPMGIPHFEKSQKENLSFTDFSKNNIVIGPAVAPITVDEEPARTPRLKIHQLRLLGIRAPKDMVKGTKSAVEGPADRNAVVIALVQSKKSAGRRGELEFFER